MNHKRVSHVHNRMDSVFLCLFGAACIKLLPWLSSSSSVNAYYSKAMEIKIHLDSKGAGHGGGGSVVPTSNAGRISEISLRASIAGDRISGRACSEVV